MLEVSKSENVKSIKHVETNSLFLLKGAGIISFIVADVIYVQNSNVTWVRDFTFKPAMLTIKNSSVLSFVYTVLVSVVNYKKIIELTNVTLVSLQNSSSTVSLYENHYIDVAYKSIINIIQSTGRDGEEDMPNPLIEPKRLKQILTRVTLDALTIHPGGILLYPTEPQTALIDSVIINYDSFLNVLRCKTYIVSLPQVEIPIPDPTSTTADVNAIALQLVNSPKCNLLFTLRKDTVVIESIEVSVYNSTVVQQLDLIPYLSDLVFYGMQHGVSLYVQVIDVGWGIIGINDYIDIQGSAVEEASAFVRKDYSVINLIQ